MSQLLSELRLKSFLVALSLAAMICVGCGDDSGPAEEVADQDEIAQWLAENPEADVDMNLDDEEAVDE